MDKLSVGMSVNIARSNGRVHPALVTNLNQQSGQVSVEWFEMGETKGKDIELKVIMQNNADLFRPVATLPTSASKNSLASSVDGGGPQKARTRHSVSTSQPHNQKIQQHSQPVSKTFDDNERTLEIEKLSIGMSVNIERSDGRVHAALVTGLNHQTGQVSVEWFEMGETKGKDMDLKIIIRNNTDIFRPAVPTLSNHSSVKNSMTSVNGGPAQKFRTRHSQIATSSRETQVLQPPQTASSSTPLLNKTFDNSDATLVDSADRRRTHAVTKPANVGAKKATQKLPPLTNIVEDFLLGDVEDQLLTPEFPMENDIKENNKPIVVVAPPPPPPVLAQQQPHQQEQEEAPRSRKTQLLSNIEGLERNRVQRRVQQGEARKQRAKQMQIDPGNPNWEFLAMVREYQGGLVYRPLRETDPVVDNRICVCVRKRPLSKKELTVKEIEVVTIPNKDHVIVHQPQMKVDLTKFLVNNKFRFDYTFNENCSNELVYRFSAQPLIRTIFQGGFATCFAYGQTGSGKTHTMGGIIEGKIQDCSKGVYAMAATDVFDYLHSPQYHNAGLTVTCSFFEIYGTKVFDLLNKKTQLRILEDGKQKVQVVGLKEVPVHCVQDVLKLIKMGSDQRTAGQTSANSNSSRSHAVFQIILRKREKSANVVHGKFSLIDLAGNERGADTISSDRQTRLEGAEINKSLLALKECIRAMGRDEQHIPFRGSKLTLILRDSFVGRNARTCMIAMISPGISCVENTMNTLRYADRVKELANDQRDDMEPLEEQEEEDEEEEEVEDFLGMGANYNSAQTFRA